MTRAELQSTRSGFIISDAAFEDYELKANHPYRVDVGDDYVCIGNSIRIDNLEIRDDMLSHLSWSETK